MYCCLTTLRLRLLLLLYKMFVTNLTSTDPAILLGVATSVVVIAVSVLTSRKSKDSIFPGAKRHRLTVSSGRCVAYYISEEDSSSEGNPVLYLHGLPGTGAAAAFFETPVVGIDRPGLGYTDFHNMDKEDPFATCCQDVWELVEHLNWKSFSVIGISGGGPHTLALLASYLESTSNAKPRINNVVLVAGLCFSAGADGTMPDNQKGFEWVKSYESSTASCGLLHLVCWIRYCIFRFLPTNLIHKIVEASTKDLPMVDKAKMKEKLETVTGILQAGLRQGSAGYVQDFRRCFWPNSRFETILKHHYSSKDKGDLPDVYIHHGEMDANASFAQATYMHQELFQKKSTLRAYKKHGHLSLIFEKGRLTWQIQYYNL